ncbi:MAG: hypothetical protein NTV40_09410 [Solirubrobacterales bacterium]|nr:hypothetical protein [Solirubrobacterales bacterium]
MSDSSIYTPSGSLGFLAMHRMIAIVVSVLTTGATLAAFAPAALATKDEGQGWWGETSDQVVTNAGFILIIFFPLFVALMSLIQWKLEKRKDVRKATQKKLRASSDATWRGGW